MSIFRKKPKGGPNLSSRIQENHIWSLQREESFCAGERVTAVAYDRTLRIYVCGFANGELHLYGDAPVHHTFRTLPSGRRNVTSIQIAPRAKRLACLVENKMMVWSLDGILEGEPLTTIDLHDGTTFIGVSILHSHALLPHPDGTVHMYDLSRLCESPTKVVPSPDVSEGVIMDLASNPLNVDFLVAATYGSLYLWQFSAHQTLRTFLLPEGAALRPVCLAFHPHEPIFVAGMADGKFAFWNIDDGVPLFVTTISELASEQHHAEGVSEVPEPVFKLTWSWVSETSRLFLHILGGQPAGSRLTTLEFAGTPFSETDQLVPKSAIFYKDYDTANIKDFVVLEDSGHVLVLNEDGSLLFIPFTVDQDIQESDQRAGDAHYIPYELRRRNIVCQTVICSLEKLRQISRPEDQCKQKGFAEGGVARSHSLKDGPDPRLVKYEAPFLLIGLHEDGIIHVDDISPRLLVDSEVLESSYPQHLPSLSVDLKGILEEPLLWASLDDASSLSVLEVTFVPEALELYVLFKTGEVLVCKYQDEPPTDGLPVAPSPHLVDLSSLATKSHGFAPRFVFSCNEGACVALATCEVGFTAVAYSNSSIYILDMRGPNVMFHQKLLSADGDAILKLQFTICRPDPKSLERLLLLAFHISGLVSVLTIQKGISGWAVDKKVEEIPARKSIPHPISCFLVNILTGGELEATAAALSSLLSEKPGERVSKLSYEGGFYRVTVSKTAVRCDMGFSGKNLKTLQLGGTLDAGIINKDASSALALFREEGAVTIVSLPNLETIADIQEKSLRSGCAHTARFLGGSGVFSVKTLDGLEIWTVYPSARVKRPDIFLPLPAALSSGQEGGLISWLLGTRVMTGEDFDSLVAGPNRPSLPTNALESGNELYEAMTVTEERGRLVATLQDKTDELEQAAEGMAVEAQKLAAKTQSKRRRFGF